jgi:uncharacterized phage protein gp47/JayE
MAFNDSFDTILNRILTDYLNQDPTTDVSQGGPVFIKSAALASALWGLEQDVAYVDAQRFADTCDEETLDHYIAVRGLLVVTGESKAAKKVRVLADIRQPPAGGNQYDYPRWAKEASPLVKGAWCVPLGQGPGTVDVVLQADSIATGTEIPTPDLCALVRAYIVDLCPGDVKYLRVLPLQLILQPVSIARIGADYPAANAVVDVTSYMAAMAPGAPLYLDQLKTLALGGGAGSAPVLLPAADVPATAYQAIRPGGIDVT